MPSTGMSTKEENALEKTTKVDSPPARKRGRPSKDSTKEVSQETSHEDIKGKTEKKAEQQVESLDVSQNEQPLKRKRGRPPKVLSEAERIKREAKKNIDPTAPKRGRGRPKKIVSN